MPGQNLAVQKLRMCIQEARRTAPGIRTAYCVMDKSRPRNRNRLMITIRSTVRRIVTFDPGAKPRQTILEAIVSKNQPRHPQMHTMRPHGPRKIAPLERRQAHIISVIYLIHGPSKIALFSPSVTDSVLYSTIVELTNVNNHGEPDVARRV
jgi:hypothetical protein